MDAKSRREELEARLLIDKKKVEAMNVELELIKLDEKKEAYEERLEVLKQEISELEA